MRRACELPQSLRLSRLRDSSEHFAASEAPARGIPCLSRLEPHLTLLFSTHLSIVPQVVICEKRRRFADRSVHLRRKCRQSGREGDETWAPMTHTSHHRGQQLALRRMLGREEYSNYGLTADTGGLMQNHAPTIYAYPSLVALFEGEAAGGKKTALPGPGQKPVTERPTP
jgi:hypothetical protein